MTDFYVKLTPVLLHIPHLHMHTLKFMPGEQELVFLMALANWCALIASWSQKQLQFILRYEDRLLGAGTARNPSAVGSAPTFT